MKVLTYEKRGNINTPIQSAHVYLHFLVMSSKIYTFYIQLSCLKKRKSANHL